MRYILDIDPKLAIESPYELKVIPDVVFLTGEINEDSAAQFRKDIEVAESLASSNGQKILPIVIDSNGGDVYAALSIIDAIEACQLVIATVVEGKAWSAAVDILVCGAEGYRFCGPRATIMMHSLQLGGMGSLPEMVESVEEATRLDGLLLEHLDNRCGQKKGYFKKLLEKSKKTNWFMSPSEAQKHRLINHIRIPSVVVRIPVIYEFI